MVAKCSIDSKPEQSFRFVTGGDIHYKIPDYSIADYFVEPVAKELAAMDMPPQFYLQTGDFFHAAGGTDADAEADYGFQHFSSTIGMPFYIAKGNHDKRAPYERNALPIFSRELGQNITTSYYSFSKANCHFLILDCMNKDYSDQLAWAEADLKAAAANPAIDHIFSFSHYPLWIVARSGFTNPAFAQPFSELLARYGVDAHFCGHTHNKSVTVKTINGQPLTQIMDASVVEVNRLFDLAPFTRRLWPTPVDVYRPRLLPLGETRRIFLPPEEVQYNWGYQEGTASSYNVVTVQGGKVTVDWHVLGDGVQRSYEWTTPGVVTNTMEQPPLPSHTLKGGDLSRIQQAWLYVSPWTKAEEVHAPFSVNGIPAGSCIITREAVAHSPFWNMLEIPLAPTAVTGLRQSNTLTFTNPGTREFGLAHLFLLAQLDDGRLIKTDIAPQVYASFQMANQETFFPRSELIRPVNTGDALATIPLSFEKSYTPEL